MTLNQLFQLLGILFYYRAYERDKNMTGLLEFHIQVIRNEIAEQLGGVK
jgi:hypothetical protein